jgi:hypothetical protein
MTWRDVIKALACCGTALLMVLAVIWAIETQWKIEILQEDVQALRAAQRPLVTIPNTKYLTIFTQEKEVVIETTQRGAE